MSALSGTPIESAWPGLPALEGSVDPFSFRQRLARFARLIDAIGRDGRFGPEVEPHAVGVPVAHREAVRRIEVTGPPGPGGMA